jgi:protein disulfide-isomerase
MKSQLALLFALSLLVAGCATAKKPYDGPGPFDKTADAPTQVTNALVEAGSFDKNVLLIFGANWCSDSRATVKLFETNSLISSIVSESYVIERIDVGPKQSGRNADLVERYHATIDQGIPVLVVLDDSGQLLNDTREERLADDDHKHPERIVEFLHRHEPKGGGTP